MANTIYFKAKFSKKLDKKLTKPDSFSNINEAKNKIYFMPSIKFLQYHENNDFQFVSKPYKTLLNNTIYITFTFLLPTPEEVTSNK